MKKITIFLCLLAGYLIPAYSQCTSEALYPFTPTVSNNSGVAQQISDCVYAGDYSVINGLTVGGDYKFTCTWNDDTSVHRYLTVKDADDNVIAHGISPLTVNDITASSIRLHYSLDADCGTENECSTATILTVLSCPLPLNAQLSAVTTTGASFTWTQGGSETAWQVLVLGENEDAPTSSTSGTPVLTTAAWTTTVPLAVGTGYKFYVRSDCGSEYSPWGGPYNFSTACNSVAAFTQSFETTALDEVPDCWTAILAGASSNAFIETGDFMGYQSTNSIQLANSDSAPTANIMLVSPPLSTMTTGTHRVKFNTVGYGDGEIEVGTVNSQAPNAIFTLKETVPVSNTYTEVVVDFSDYTGTDTYLAFRHPNTTDSNPVFLDNIRWELSPLCPDVTALTVDGVTTTSGSVSWTPGGAETQWDVVYAEQSVSDPTGLNPIVPAPTGTPAATIPGLTPNTAYNAWVRSVCGGTDGDGAWIGPISFRTACLAVNTISENFTSTPTGEMPDCWTAIFDGEDVSQYAYIEVSSGSGVEGGKGLRLYNNDSGSDSNIIAVMPNLGNLSAGTHRLKFMARTDGTSSLEVGTISSATNGTTFTSMESIDLTGTYAEYVVDFTGYTGTDTFIGLRYAGTITYTGINIDNVRWEVAPACADVTDIEIHTITTSSAEVFWVANGSESAWDVVYGPATATDPSALTPISPAPSVSPGASISGLSPNTSYNVWVRSACGGTIGDGAWIGPITFTTACLPVPAFAENFDTTNTDELPGCWSAILSGDTVSQYAYVETTSGSSVSGENSVEIYVSDSGEEDYVMLVSPNLSTLGAGTHRLKFQSYIYNGGTLEIGTLNGNTDTATFTVYEQITIGDEFDEYVVDFTNYTGTDTYIGIRNTTGPSSSAYLDDIKWEVMPLCADVDDIYVDGITTATANVNWEAGGSESGWQVAYGPVSTTDPATLTPSPVQPVTTYALPGLTDNTAYKVWVRSVCGGTEGNGAWIGPVTFTTLCVAGTVPYTENFETAVAPALAGCTTSINVGGGSDWITEEAPGFGFTNMTALYSFDSDNPADAWLFTRGLQLTAGESYKISYKYGNNSEDTYTEKMKVMYGLSADVAGMTIDLADHPEIIGAMAMTNEVTFTPPTTGTYYFGFHAYSDANQYDLYLDDIAVDAALGAPQAQTGVFTYYPNPVKDVLKLSYTNAITNVTVYNLLGQAVINTAMNQNEASIDMSRLPAGNYIVKVSADTMTKTIKVIKG